jgi:predicted polyphosphate/ATP-dependent NAD kinase
MNRVAAVSLLTALVIAVTGCARSDPRFATPRDTLAVVARAVRENNYKLLRETLAEVDGKPEHYDENRFDDLSEEWTSEYEIVKEEEIVKGEKVAITARMELPSGARLGRTHRTVKMYFQKEGADWKLLVTQTESLDE